MAQLHLQGVDMVFPDGTQALSDVALEVEDGELVVLLGPSGCGKSTLLRVVAGLEQPTRGAIRLGGRDIVRLPPQQRGVAMVFQNYALYPHMTVQQNLEFPLRMAREKGRSTAERVEEVLRRLDIEPLRGKRPRELSGGQQQRVAMGRALVRRPGLFLLDEPLSNLDARLRARIRGEIALLQRELGVTTLYVTHDQVEAMSLGRRIAVLREGRVLQYDSPDAVHGRPIDTFVADFVGANGINLLRVRRERDHLRIFGGENPIAVVTMDSEQQRRVEILGARFDALRLVDPGSRQAHIKGVVRVVERIGSERLLHIDSNVALLRPDDPSQVDSERELLVRGAADDRVGQEGDTVGVSVDLARTISFDSDGRAVDPACPTA